ncbi:hypothetical protein [Thalassospira sp. TSL5-1]|uniref:hypothetical protein n=1 Tax=Thalassospira sp. TSL5-1 TaxID=1544451 RepID=UPI000A712357|nr:hypothetical protein [Thalassospira sp. TSL5-1]
MNKSYVQTLMEVEKVFGQINDHDYRLYRAVWGNRRAADIGMPRGTRAEISRKLADDFTSSAHVGVGGVTGQAIVGGRKMDFHHAA